MIIPYPNLNRVNREASPALSQAWPRKHLEKIKLKALNLSSTLNKTIINI